MKTYKIKRQPDKVIIATVKGKLLKHIIHHSPTGFEFGYDGSGPADLALAILADYFGEDPTQEDIRLGRCRCWQPHQNFKRRFIANQRGNSFTITEEDIASWLKQEAKRK